jgi:hypothetical protein
MPIENLGYHKNVVTRLQFALRPQGCKRHDAELAGMFASEAVARSAL